MSAGAFDPTVFYARVDRLYRDGRGDDVYRYLADTLAAARRSRDYAAIAAAASELGGVERARGNLAHAEDLYDEALRAHDASFEPNVFSLVNLLINKGDVLVARGRYGAAIDLFCRAESLLPMGPETAYQRSAICNNRSVAYRELGEYGCARRDLRRAVRLLDHVDDAAGKRAVTRVSLAQTLVKEGRVEEARREVDLALSAYETLSGGRDIHRPNAYACSAQIAYLTGDYPRAVRDMRAAAVALQDKVGDSPMVERLWKECRRMERLAAWEEERI